MFKIRHSRPQHSEETHRLEINIGRFRRRGDTTAAAVVGVVGVAVVGCAAAAAAGAGT